MEAGTERPAGERHFSQGRKWIRPPWRQQLVNNNPSDTQKHMRISRVQKATEQWRTDPPLTSVAQVEPAISPG